MDYGQFAIMFSRSFSKASHGPTRVSASSSACSKTNTASSAVSANEVRIQKSTPRAAEPHRSPSMTERPSPPTRSSPPPDPSEGRLCSNQAPDAEADNIGQLSFTETITVFDAPPATSAGTHHHLFQHSGAISLRALRHRPRRPPTTSSAFQITTTTVNVSSTRASSASLPWPATTTGAHSPKPSISHKNIGMPSCQSHSTSSQRQSSTSTHTASPKTCSPPARCVNTLPPNGAIYGAPNKIKDGRTHLENLYLAGTDQGFLGIVGAMLSGISMANLHMLRRLAVSRRWGRPRCHSGPLARVHASARLTQIS